MAVVVNDYRGDRPQRWVPLQPHGHRVRLAIDCVPDELNNGAYRITLVGQPGNKVITSLQHQFGHMLTLDQSHRDWAQRSH